MKYILIKVPDDLFIGEEWLPHCELTKKELEALDSVIFTDRKKEVINKIKKVLENDIK